MSPCTRRLAEAVAAHLAEWDTPFVELAIFGHADPARIAAALDALCADAVGSRASGVLFYQSSVAAVAGLVLRDSRRVVVKAHQPDQPEAALAELARLQAHVASSAGLAPRPLAGPLPFAAESRLPDHLLGVRAGDALWPRPHSRLFDFDATRRGAEDIDALAELARAALQPAGRIVLGHGDWRVEHLRFDGARVVLAYDWQSVCRCEEAALIGFAAHAFCADWSRDDPRQAPTLAEARAFVADYEGARGAPFARDERRLCGAAFAYSVAYTARCGHAGGYEGRDVPGSFHHLLAEHGDRLLTL